MIIEYINQDISGERVFESRNNLKFVHKTEKVKHNFEII